MTGPLVPQGGVQSPAALLPLTAVTSPGYGHRHPVPGWGWQAGQRAGCPIPLLGVCPRGLEGPGWEHLSLQRLEGVPAPAQGRPGDVLCCPSRDVWWVLGCARAMFWGGWSGGAGTALGRECSGW